MVGIKSCPTSSSPSPQLTQMRKMFSDRLRALALADSLFLLFTVLTMGVPRDPIQHKEFMLEFWPEKMDQDSLLILFRETYPFFNIF